MAYVRPRFPLGFLHVFFSRPFTAATSLFRPVPDFVLEWSGKCTI